MATSIEQRHGNGCRRPKSGCRCPWRASVYSKRDGRKIRNFTNPAAPRTLRGFIDWQGAKRLSPGRHIITVLALDRYRNTARRAVTVVKVKG